MSNEGRNHMHASCYLAIAIAYTIAVVAYAILAFAAFTEERQEPPLGPPAAEAPSIAPEAAVMLAKAE